MKRFFFALSSLALFSCGEDPNVVVLKDNQGGAFIIVEMPTAGASDTSINQLEINIFNSDNDLLSNLKFNNNELKSLPNGPWPTTRGTCVPLRGGLLEAPPATFLPSDSSCLTFALIHDFNVDDQTDNEIIVTLDIQAKDGNNKAKAFIAHTIRIERGIFKGDPVTATKTTDLTPSIASLFVPVIP
jgi:hypothetical protein